MNALKLTPLLRDPASWNTFPSLWDALANMPASSSPPCNIVAQGDNSYAVSVNVAGFRREDLEISTHRNVLRISGQAGQTPETQETGDKSRYLHKGMSQRSFDLSFSLADQMEVTGAELKDGILQVTLKSQTPEEPPKQIVEIKAA